jgi:hypothetical protein
MANQVVSSMAKKDGMDSAKSQMQVKPNMTPNSVLKNKPDMLNDLSPGTTAKLESTSIINKGMSLNPVSNLNVTNFDEAEKMTQYGQNVEETHLRTKDLDQDSNTDYV